MFIYYLFQASEFSLTTKQACGLTNQKRKLIGNNMVDMLIHREVSIKQTLSLSKDRI